MGSVYLRGKIYWVAYMKDGQQLHESSRSNKKGEAERLLKKREGDIVEGRFHGLGVEKITLVELAEDYLADYRINDRKSLKEAIRHTAYLKKAFPGPAQSVTTAVVKNYIEKCQAKGLANGTINRILAALKRMYKLGMQCTPPKVTMMPYIPHLKEDNVRQGFFEYAEYVRLRATLPLWLKPVLTIAFCTGMRLGEIRSLLWSQVNLIEGRINLDPKFTKGGDSRILYLTGEVFEAILQQKLLRDEKFPDCPWVFFTPEGNQVKDFRKTWARAFKEAGLQPRLFHDLRRSGVRNLIRAGVPDKEAMKISGHKTADVFQRYNIVNEKDLKAAMQKVQVYHETLQEQL